MLARVFPRKTNATPDDEMAFFDVPPVFFPDIKLITEVHVSVTFTWDIPRAKWLAKQWEQIAPVKIGGPAMGTVGEEFVPGKYVKPGYVITSRGCPNRCWFCSVWKRDGNIRELPIHDGHHVLDDNVLACSDQHVQSVFNMLSRQKEKALLNGGLEAAILKDWHARELAKLKPKQIFLAYDTPEDYEPLVVATKKLFDAGITKASHAIRCYVFIGYPKDTIVDAEKRLMQVLELGVYPMAMLWKHPKTGMPQNNEWKKFQRLWARPIIIATTKKNAETSPC